MLILTDGRRRWLSSKSEGFESYGVDLLADDISGLSGELGAESTFLVGHDWGGSIAWTVAMNHPEVVDRLAILNAAHPRKLSEGLKHPSQLRKSWYFFFFFFFFFFATPGLPRRSSPSGTGTSSDTSCKRHSVRRLRSRRRGAACGSLS